MATKAIAIQPAENEIILICGLEASAGYERVFNTLRLKSQIRIIFILSGRLFACGKLEFITHSPVFPKIPPPQGRSSSPIPPVLVFYLLPV